MKLFKIASIAAVATLALAAQASAASFTPPSTSFTGIGATNMIKGLGPFPCAAKFTGHTDAAPPPGGTSYAWIDSAAFTGSVFCTSVTAASLPWRARVTSGPATAGTPATAVIEQVKFNSPVGPCGPADLNVTIDVAGNIAFHQTLNPGACEVWTTTPIATTPAVGVIYP